MVQYFPVITGSLTVNGNLSVSGNVAVTGSMSGTSSLAANAELLSGTGSVGFTTTGSFTVASSSLSSRTTQIESVYATTGSNSFRATQSITGSLTVTGQIVAQTLNVQQVTSSIVYSSGSNVFGCDLNSRQTFTGSMFVTGSINSYGNLIVSTSISPGIEIIKNASVDNRYFRLTNSQPSSKNWDLINQTNTNGNNFQIYNSTDNVSTFLVSPSGSISFGTVITNSHIITGSVNITGSLKLTGCVLGPLYINTTGSGANAQLDIIHGSGQEGIAIKMTGGVSSYSPIAVRDSFRDIFQFNQYGRLYATGSFMLGDPYATEGSSVNPGSIAIFPSSSVSSAPLIQFSANGRIRPGNTGDRLSIDGNSLYLNGTFSANVIMATGGGNVLIGGTSTIGSSKLSTYGSIAAQNGGVDASYAEAFTAYYSSNNTESNAILTSVSSTATNSGFRFDASNGAGSAARTTVLTLNRSAAIFAVNVGVGITPASGIKLDVYGNIALNDQALRWRSGGDANHATIFDGTTNGPFMYGYYGAALGYTSAGSARRVIWTDTTSYYNYGNTTTWNQTSDCRIKQNVNDISNAICKISLLRPIKFDYTDQFAQDRNWTDKQKLNNVGFIAQEYEEAFPDDVQETTEKIGDIEYTDFKTINASSIIPYLVKGMQEQQCIICSQASMINTLKTCIGIA